GAGVGVAAAEGEGVAAAVADGAGGGAAVAPADGGAVRAGGAERVGVGEGGHRPTEGDADRGAEVEGRGRQRGRVDGQRHGGAGAGVVGRVGGGEGHR